MASLHNSPPTAKEIEDAFDCTPSEAMIVADILANAPTSPTMDEARDTLLECAKVLDPAGKQGFSVRIMGVNITHPDNSEAEYFSETVGSYLDHNNGGWDEGTICYLYGKYMAHEVIYDRELQKAVPAQRDEGFYVSSEAGEQQSFEDLFEEVYLRTDQKKHDYWEWLGPRDDDLYTEDFVTFKHYTEYHDRRKHKTAFRLDLSARQLPDSEDGEPRYRERPGIVSAEGDLDDPWSFYKDHIDAYWRLFYKQQDTDGYYGSIWFLESGRDGKYKLLTAPKGLAWQMAEEWRKEYRARNEPPAPITAEDVQLTPEAVGIQPRVGDLVTDNLHAHLPYGVLIYRVARSVSGAHLMPGEHALHVTQREIEEGLAWSRVITTIAQFSQYEGRMVQLWHQPLGWASPWTHWVLIPTITAPSNWTRKQQWRPMSVTPSPPQSGGFVIGPPPRVWIKPGGFSGLTSKRKKRRRRR